MVRLRPNSVSTEATDMQFDLLLQSPQPSHTRSLMTTRVAGSGNLPRLRRRRFSAAQVWSDQRAHTRHLAQFALHRVELVAVADRHPVRQVGRAVGAAVPFDDDDVGRPRRRGCAAMIGTDRVPSCGCPPVMATASL